MAVVVVELVGMGPQRNQGMSQLLELVAVDIVAVVLVLESQRSSYLVIVVAVEVVVEQLELGRRKDQIDYWLVEELGVVEQQQGLRMD